MLPLEERRSVLHKEYLNEVYMHNMVDADLQIVPSSFSGSVAMAGLRWYHEVGAEVPGKLK
jgi:hypothetical protein